MAKRGVGAILSAGDDGRDDGSPVYATRGYIDDAIGSLRQLIENGF